MQLGFMPVQGLLDIGIAGLTCEAGDYVKIYKVPKSYSDDGLYIAKWRYGELEPAPACAGDAMELIADLQASEQDGQVVYNGMIAEGKFTGVGNA